MVFSLFLLIGMILIGGIAIDVARYERVRTELQHTIDNAVLAAASLSQTMTPKEVVDSWFDAAGFGHLEPVVAAEDEKTGPMLVGRTVDGSVKADLSTYFLRIWGYEELPVTVASVATERVDDIEISLVLDVSGSMAQDSANTEEGTTKLQELQRAATSFVTKILEQSEPGRVSINLVPYASQVNAGAALLSSYTTSDEHSYSNCIEFETDDFKSAGISTGTKLNRNGHFLFQLVNASDPLAGQWHCRIDDGFEITAVSQSVDDLTAQISKLTAEGSTSIDIGIKWGTALLDESAQTPVSNLIDAGKVDEAFRGRPLPYDASNSMKVLVVMTDGENFPEYRLKSDFASGASDVWRAMYSGNGLYTVHDPEGSGEDLDDDKKKNEPYFFATVTEKKGSYYLNGTGDHFWDATTAGDKFGLSEIHMTWPQVWAEMSYYWHHYNLRTPQGRRYGLSDWPYTPFYTIDASTKNSRMSAACSAAKAKGIVVYTIGFEAPETYADLLRDCAWNETHYFPVEGLKIDDAFDMIASSISMLRLTQ